MAHSAAGDYKPPGAKNARNLWNARAATDPRQLGSLLHMPTPLRLLYLRLTLQGALYGDGVRL